MLARAALAWERLWPALWPAAGVAGLFLAVALFNILPDLPGWLHLLVLLLFAGGFVAALGLGLRRLRLPDWSEAQRRLEQDSGLAHRPLTVLRDRLAGDPRDPALRALWRLHQERARARLDALRVRPPRPNLAARDPRALRAAVALVLFVAAAGTWGDWRPRLTAALTPGFGADAATASVVLDIWVTPPEYTGLAPIFLTPPDTGASDDASGRSAAPVPVPAGSTLLARVNGGRTTPNLDANGETVRFETVESRSYQIERTITGGERIAVRQGGRELGAWPIQVVPDRTPEIDFVVPPAASERQAVRLEYQARDDYGLVGVTATLRLDGTAAGLADRTPIELPLGLPGLRPTEARAVSFHDLTPHPWAGLPVTLRLTATDAAGQSGHSREMRMVLPERTFTHPVARAVIAQRKRLILNGDAAREEVARNLSMLSIQPHHYGEDIVVFLALRTAAARLVLDREPQALTAVRQLLWDTALRIEDGTLSIAERALREAEQALMDALDRNASDAELEELMTQLEQALNAFLDALEQHLREQMARGEMPTELPPDLPIQTLDRDDLREMLEQMRQLAETGARDAARQMLSQLQQMLENLRTGNFAQTMDGSQIQQGMEMLQELQELTRRQQELLDQTFRQARPSMEPSPEQQMPWESWESIPRERMGPQAGRPDPSGRSALEGAAQQEALRRQLGDLMRRLGEMTGDIPRPLGRAERAMREAEQALGQGAPSQAVPPQTRAVDELQQGLQSFAEQMMQQMQTMTGLQPGAPMPRPMGRADPRRDPLGRPLPGQGVMDTGDVEIPEASEMQRAREILDELRRRAGEYHRPQIELDYIERLLDRF